MVDFTDKKAFEEAISANMQYSDFYRDNKERLGTFVSYYESCKDSAASPIKKADRTPCKPCEHDFRIGNAGFHYCENCEEFY